MTIDLREWSLKLVEIIDTLDPEVSMKSQETAMQQALGSDSSVLWRARRGTDTWILPEIGASHVVQARPVYPNDYPDISELVRGVEIALIEVEEVEAVHPCFVGHETYLVREDSDRRLSMWRCGLGIKEGVSNYQIQSGADRFFYNYQRITSYYVALNEYQLTTHPVAL